MSLIDTIKKDSVKARIAKDTVAANLLVTLLAEVTKVGKDKGNRETTDEEAIAVVKKFVNNLDESEKNLGRTLGMVDDIPELDATAEKYTKALLQTREEKTLLQKYIPQQLSKEELEAIIKGLNTKNVGEIMKHLKENHASLYDGKLASEIAKGL